MTRAERKILGEALELTVKRRAHLAAAIIESLDAAEHEDPAEVERAWAAEIEQRVVALRAGKTKLIPWETARAQVAARLRKRS